MRKIVRCYYRKFEVSETIPNLVRLAFFSRAQTIITLKITFEYSNIVPAIIAFQLIAIVNIQYTMLTIFLLSILIITHQERHCTDLCQGIWCECQKTLQTAAPVVQTLSSIE